MNDDELIADLVARLRVARDLLGSRAMASAVVAARVAVARSILAEVGLAPPTGCGIATAQIIPFPRRNRQSDAHEDSDG